MCIYLIKSGQFRWFKKALKTPQKYLDCEVKYTNISDKANHDTRITITDASWLLDYSDMIRGKTNHDSKMNYLWFKAKIRVRLDPIKKKDQLQIGLHCWNCIRYFNSPSALPCITHIYTLQRWQAYVQCRAYISPDQWLSDSRG